MVNTTGRGAPLRAWAREGNDERDELMVGATTFALINAAPGDRVTVRVVSRIPEQ